MAIQSLWGELPDTGQMRTPALVLKEQAQALTELTKGVLEGRVSSRDAGYGQLSHQLQIVAPVLNGYSYTVAEVQHGISLYPLTLTSPGLGTAYQCPDEPNFKDILQMVLTSESVKRAIAGLLVQSRQTDG